MVRSGDKAIRNVCFTWNNPQDIPGITSKLQGWSQVTYCVFGEEIAPNTGTPHLQGYLEFKNPVEWKTCQKKLNNSHMEERKGSAMDASNYCKKGEQSHEEWKDKKQDGENFGTNAKVTEWGEISKQGKRNDIHEATEMIQSGKRMREVAMEHPVPFVKYHKGFQALQKILIEPRNEVPEIKIFYGLTGSKKSFTARQWLESDFYVWHPQQGQWFDGYEGEKKVLFEEFRGQVPWGMLLSLLDRYDCKVQYKGGIMEFVGTKIAITSPVHPMFWYKLTGDDRLDQLYRRIGGEENIINLSYSPPDPPTPGE